MAHSVSFMVIFFQQMLFCNTKMAAWLVSAQRLFGGYIHFYLFSATQNYTSTFANNTLFR